MVCYQILDDEAEDRQDLSQTLVPQHLGAVSSDSHAKAKTLSSKGLTLRYHYAIVSIAHKLNVIAWLSRKTQNDAREGVNHDGQIARG